ncbi:ATP-binding protein [Puia dinghuensis]|uniref:ATPase n=1 Tax=Puia dinghuensis TaxID=1792502 RepID=A0A8J2UB86_9BACT|nr:ATP-binding protein [Puia dinghuensis]GGA91307.1 ATPase [Puia dinghuensis]
MNYIRRPHYSDKIIPFIDKQIIKVLTGQRRVGKSFVLYQLMDEIKKKYKNANIVYINRELEDFLFIQDHKDLNNYLKEKAVEGEKNYLFIDEVQEISDFQLSLRSLLAKNTWDIYCTGSNARMLSGELATTVAGRYIEFHIHALNFQEFILFHDLENNFEALMKYLQFGGMPYLRNIGFEENLPYEYLRNVYSTILLKDVVARENIRNVSFLENLVTYLCDNVGNLFSASNISKFLRSQRIDISPQLTINYLKALANAYFVYRVPRTEIGGLKIFEIGEKYYFEDLGLRNAIRGFNQRSDIHKLLENAVYKHLIQQGYRVYVGKLGHNEIDFSADKNGQKIHVQVALTVNDKDTERREFGNLLLIPDNYPKFVVTLNDPMLGNDYKGVKQLNLLEFLNEIG